ncbi:MAG: HAMP domain-containing histidine kinase [Planctomycetaceae bacterium]|jgi:signal transduction histidine kinase|nr:HAMP domain-containing histidine kinase [Planctomycetaceae bacterium]
MRGRLFSDSRSLEVKCMLFFFAALSLALAISFLLYLYATQALIQQQNPVIANTWTQQYLMESHWDVFGEKPAANFGTGANNDTFKSDAFKTDFRKRMEDITKRIRNKEIHTSFIANASKLEDIYNIGSLDVAKKEAKKNQTDKQWHDNAAALNQFPIYSTNFKAELDAKYIDRYDKDGTYHYYEEVRMNSKSECVLCHKSFVDGELMGVVHIAVPKKSARQTIQKYLAYMLAAAIISIFLSLVAVNIVIRWLVIKPLRSLRTVSDAIARGEINKRADIHTGDEFEMLADAFNRMLHHLGLVQDKLRTANADLENKVNELAHQTVRLHEMNRIKSDFMATMSHELRTPLNSILGFSDVLSSISTLNDKQKKYVDNINKSGRSLLTMINDILDLAKIESGRMDVQVTQFSITAVVSAQLDMAKPLGDKKNIQLDKSLEETVPPMTQDVSKIQQILNNLLSNAVKFTPEGGRITVSVKLLPAVPVSPPRVPPPIAGAALERPRNRDFLELKVADTGVGISEEDQKIIFEKFRQGTSMETPDDTLKREHSGSGLGLSIVREICRMLEGDIAVESQLGFGSTFTVHLPWTLQSKPRSGSDISADIQQFAQNRVNILRAKEQ